MMMRLADPQMLLLLILPALVAWWLWRHRRSLRPRMKFSSLGLMLARPRTLRSRLLALPVCLLVLTSMLIILAMARPQSAWRERRRFTEGIDIMLVTDVSGSMQALDFTPNRLEAAKATMAEFVKSRADDQIGVVIFADQAFTLAPLTQDQEALDTFIQRINFDLIDGDGTAIGMGLAVAVNRLRESKAKSKVAILLTDGENNAGKIDPISAAEIAKEFGIRVYTIGVGTIDGIVNIPQASPWGIRPAQIRSQLDVDQLTQMAEMTGGQFFHATDGASLEKIYGQIDRMERTKHEATETQYYDELAGFLIVPAVLLLMAAFFLEQTWLRTFP